MLHRLASSRTIALSAIVLFSLLPSAAREPAASPAPEPTLQVSGAVGKSAHWTAAQLATQFAGDIKPISYTLKGVKHTAQ